MRSNNSLPQRVRKLIEFHAQNTQKEKNRNAFYSLYTYKIDINHYMMRVGIHYKVYFKGYFKVCSGDCSSDDYHFYIEEGYHGDLYDHENCGMPLLFEIKLNQPFKIGNTTMILEKDPKPKDHLFNYFIIKQL